MTILSSDYVRTSSYHGRIVFILAEAIQGVSAEIYITQNFVAGAVFGEVGG